VPSWTDRTKFGPGRRSRPRSRARVAVASARARRSRRRTSQSRSGGRSCWPARGGRRRRDGDGRGERGPEPAEPPPEEDDVGRREQGMVGGRAGGWAGGRVGRAEYNHCRGLPRFIKQLSRAKIHPKTTGNRPSNATKGDFSHAALVG
jgi:hypothetical protein